MPENSGAELDVFCMAPYNDKGEENGGQRACVA